MENQFDDLQEFLGSLPEHYQVLEEGINMDVQDEYIDFTGFFVRTKLSDAEVELTENSLYGEDLLPDDIKKSLALLAYTGSPIAFKVIREYYEKCDPELKLWAAMAMHECRVFLESDLYDTNIGFISSGLGGKNNKPRYCYLVLPIEDQLFAKLQHRIIETEITLVARSLNCEIESFDFQNSYIGITVLIPMSVAISEFIDSGIRMSNEFGDFVLEHYYVTNNEIPSKEEIPGILEKVLRG